MSHGRVFAASLVMGLTLLFNGGQPSEAGYGNGQATWGGTTQDLHAGLVTGKVGWLEDPQTSGSGTHSLVTTGTFGVHWHGQQRDHREDEKDGGLNVFHDYDADASQAWSLTISQTSAVTVSGWAQSMGGSSWWWNSSNSVDEDKPEAMACTDDGWVDLTIRWTADQQCSATSGDMGDAHSLPPVSNNNTNVTPQTSLTSSGAGNVVNGVTVGGVDDLPQGTELKVQGSWEAHAKGCVDLAVVHDDKLVLSFNFTTSVQ